MKALIVVEQLRRAVPGGIGTYIGGLLQGLREIGEVERTLLASRTVQRPDPLDAFGVPVRTLPLPSPLLTRVWDRNWWPQGKPFDLVHATAGAFPSTGRTPLTAMVHDVAWQHVPEAYPARGLAWHEHSLQRTIALAAHIVVPAEQTAAALLDRGVERSRITVVPEGANHLPPADPAATDAQLAKLGVRSEFLLTVGTLEPRKNLQRLFDAYAEVRDQLPEPWPLLVVGPTGWGEQVEVPPGVLALGRVDAAVIAGLYERCRLFASVPLLEGYGLPVVEAMTHGAPVVSSAVPSAGGASKLIDPLDRDSIAAALLEVGTDDSVREDLQQRGTAHAAATTWAATARAHVEIWETLHGQG